MSGVLENDGSGIVVGRDGLIEEIWEKLDEGSVYMNDVRRIGKTKILEKMAADGREGWVVLHRDLEGNSTANEFATAVYSMSLGSLKKGKKAFRQMGALLGKASGMEVVGVLKLGDGKEAPWKEVLRRTFADVDEAMEEHGKRLVYLWDEVPFVLGKIEKKEGSAVAMEVLDVIREVTQTHKRVRVLLTGSVGFHHVLSDLRQAGYQGSPLNHMERVAPGPLDRDEGRKLAAGQMVQLGVRAVGGENVDGYVSELVGHVPFYVRRLVGRMRRRAIDVAEVKKALLEILTDPADPWDLSHYANRMLEYYGERRELALAILDCIAGGGRANTFGSVSRVIRSSMNVDDEMVREVLVLLHRDHYLEMDVSGAYGFRLEVVRRWWCLNRSIAGGGTGA